MGQRPHVAHERAEHRPDAVIWVVGPVLHGDAPYQRRTDALAQVPGVSDFTCQIGVRTASTSALDTSETGRLPMRGKT